jgi:hypothetical protein
MVDSDSRTLDEILTIVKEIQTSMGTFASELTSLQAAVASLTANVAALSTAITNETTAITAALAAAQGTNPDPNGIVAASLTAIGTANTNLQNAVADIQAETTTVSGGTSDPPKSS